MEKNMQQELEIPKIEGPEDQIGFVLELGEDQFRFVPETVYDLDVDELEKRIEEGFEAMINFLSVGPKYTC